MGWFQTLFVYLHAMPRATVRRIWDWWLSSGDFEVMVMQVTTSTRVSCQLVNTPAFAWFFPPACPSLAATPRLREVLKGSGLGFLVSFSPFHCVCPPSAAASVSTTPVLLTGLAAGS